MNPTTRPFFFALSLALALVAPAAVHAVDLFENDDLTLELRGFGRAGVSVHAPDSGPTEYGATTPVGRLRHVAKYADTGELMIQFDGRPSGVRLLDLRLRLQICRALTVTAGLYKTPASYGFLIPAPQTEFAARPLPASVLPRRLTGVMISWAREWPVKLEVGAFVPGGDRPAELRGPVLISRALVNPVDALELHLSFTQAIERPDASDEPHDHYGRALDFGVRTEAGDWYAYAEVAVHMDDDSDFGTPIVAGLVSGYRIATSGPDIRPAVGFDLLAEDTAVGGEVSIEVRRVRAQIGTDFLWLGDDVRASIQYTADSVKNEADESELGHTATLFGQVTF